MNQILAPYLDDFAVAYLNDILIYLTDEEQHDCHLDTILAILEHENLIANPSKCYFFVDEVPFLGHIVSGTGVRMDQRKIDSITNWPSPKSVHDVQVFLGLANFYRRFIHQYSCMAAPISNLLRKDLPFHWSPACESAFTALKVAFTTAPILCIYEHTRATHVACDASDLALGGCLEQLCEDNHWHPIAFESRKFVPAELNYPVHEKELLAIVHCLKAWRHYLEGAPHFKIYTDHHSLRYFPTQANLSRRQARWSEVLASYDFELVYKPG